MSAVNGSLRPYITRNAIQGSVLGAVGGVCLSPAIHFGSLMFPTAYEYFFLIREEKKLSFYAIRAGLIGAVICGSAGASVGLIRGLVKRHF